MARTDDTTEGFLRTVEARLASGAPMDRPEHDSVMTEMFVQAHDNLPPLAFHAWAACSFASRRGLLTDEEIDALGADPYAVLFALQGRGVLAEFAKAVEVPSPREMP